MIRAWLARHVFYPAQDRWHGRASLRFAQSLEESQWADACQMHQLRITKLQALLLHAVQKVPYYIQRLVPCGGSLEQAVKTGDLSGLPLLTKDDVRAHALEMIAPGCDEELEASCTSGSTGSPLHFFVDRRRNQADVASRIRAHRWFDVLPGDPAIYLWGSRIEVDYQDRLRVLRDWLINEKLLNAFALSDAQLHRYADYFLRVKPDFIYSYASSLWRFAQFVRQKRPELKGVVRKVAFSTGEQMLPEWRREIIEALECSVAEEYGCREGGTIAHECPEGSHHIMAENIIVEILDDDGRCAPAGREGRVVVTNLEAYGMPFIRYDTGDRAALLDERCSCGRTLPLMTRPTGRSFEFLETCDGARITGVSVSRDLKEVEGISHYRVIQESRSLVRVLIVTNPRYNASRCEPEIRCRIRARIGPQTDVLIEYVDELPSHPSGKYRYVINAIGANRSE